MRFSDAIQEFGFDCRARKLSDKTISNYQKQLRYLQRYLEAEYIAVPAPVRLCRLLYHHRRRAGQFADPGFENVLSGEGVCTVNGRIVYQNPIPPATGD